MTVRPYPAKRLSPPLGPAKPITDGHSYVDVALGSERNLHRSAHPISTRESGESWLSSLSVHPVDLRPQSRGGVGINALRLLG